jgi:hypothetical protein
MHFKNPDVALGKEMASVYFIFGQESLKYY